MTPTTPLVLPPAPWDPSKPYWLQNNFAPVADQIDATNLAVEGSIPPSLSGLYVRNGANPFKADSPHWFFGDGMVHGVRLGGGRVSWYKNRFVRTPQFRKEEGDPSAPAVSPMPGKEQSQANTSMVFYAGKLLALEEVSWPYEIDQTNLATVGPWNANGALPATFTAHPKVDPATGQMHFFGYGLTPPYLSYGVLNPDGTVVSVQHVPVKGPTMMHDFAITDRDVVFWELPIVFDLKGAVAGNPFRWDPSYGARIGVMPLGGDVAQLRWVDIPPCYVFHGINAYRDDTRIVVEVCRLDRAFDGADEGVGVNNRLHKWVIETSGPQLTFSDSVLNDRALDLPTIDKRFLGRQSRYSWLVGTRDTEHAFEFSGITRWDAKTGQTVVWDPGAAVSAGEGLFIPEGKNEGEGWVLAFAYDRRDQASRLVILDATEVDKGPVASVLLPQRVPFGFHATWVQS